MSTISGAGTGTATEARRRPAPVLLACGLSWAVGLVHIQAAADHFDEYVPYALCFIAVGLVQLGWGLAVYRRPTPWLLTAGAVLSAGVVGVWVLSRSGGLPIGPDARAPETVGLLDAIATADEVALIALIGSMLRPPPEDPGLWARRVRAMLHTVALLMVFGTSLVLGGGVHAH